MSREIGCGGRRSATLTNDPDDPSSVRSPDPGENYLTVLAESQQAVLVSGDDHLLGLSEDSPSTGRPASFNFSSWSGEEVDLLALRTVLPSSAVTGAQAAA